LKFSAPAVFSAIAVLALFLPVHAMGGEKGPGGLDYMTEEYPPYNFTENGEQKGVSVDLLREIWAIMGEKPAKVSFMPWARAYRDIREKKGMALFNMARTPEREDLFQWACPITTARFMLFARAGSGVVLNSRDDISRYAVGVIRDDISEILVKKYGGGARVESVADMGLNMKKLDAGRIDLVAYSEEAFPEYLRANGLEEDHYKAALLLDEIPICFAFSKDVDAQFLDRFRAALKALSDAGRVRELLARYAD